MAKIIISNFEELNGQMNERYNIRVSRQRGYNNLNALEIRNTNDETYISETRYNVTSESIVIGWLKLYGFDVTIKKSPKLTEREYHQLMVLPKGWITRDINGDLDWCNNKPTRDDTDWTINCGDKACELFNDLFPFITWESEPVSVSTLLGYWYEDNL